MHDQYLEYLNEKQNLQENKNSLSKEFSNQKTDIEKIKLQVQDIKKKIEKLSVLADDKIKELNNILLIIPNILSD